MACAAEYLPRCLRAYSSIPPPLSAQNFSLRKMKAILGAVTGCGLFAAAWPKPPVTGGNRRDAPRADACPADPSGDGLVGMLRLWQLDFEACRPPAHIASSGHLLCDLTWCARLGLPHRPKRYRGFLGVGKLGPSPRSREWRFLVGGSC